MKTPLRWGSLFSLFIALQACVHTTKPLCVGGNIEDVPGLEGTYIVKTYSFDDFEFISQRVNIQRSARGQYTFDGQEASTTCKIGGAHYFESPTGKGYSAYRLELFTTESGERGFHLMVIGASKQELTRKGVPFQIVEGPSMFRGKRIPYANNQQKALVIDNSKLSPDESAQLFEPMSFSFTFIPTR